MELMKVKQSQKPKSGQLATIKAYLKIKDISNFTLFKTGKPGNSTSPTATWLLSMLSSLNNKLEKYPFYFNILI